MKFRAASLADIEQLRQMEQAVVDAERPFNDDLKSGDQHYYDIEQLISNELSLLLIAETLVDGHSSITACGYADVRESKTYIDHDLHAYLGFMYVDPKHRGKGLIQELIAKLFEWAKLREANHFYLDVYADNTAAIKAYEKLGFKASMIEMKYAD